MHIFCIQFHWQCYKQTNPPYIHIYSSSLTRIIQCVKIESIFNKCFFKGEKNKILVQDLMDLLVYKHFLNVVRKQNKICMNIFSPWLKIVKHRSTNFLKPMFYTKIWMPKLDVSYISYKLHNISIKWRFSINHKKLTRN
jgi:hypothetical protein